MAEVTNKRTKGFASKVTEQEIALLEKSAVRDVMDTIEGQVAGDKAGFNSNVHLGCPHVKIQKAEAGQGQEIVSALVDRVFKTEKLKGMIGGKEVEVEVEYYYCECCKQHIPFFKGNLAEIQGESSFVFKLAAMKLQTEMFYRAGFGGLIPIPGISQDGKEARVATGKDLIKMLVKTPAPRVGRFTIIKTLMNLSQVADFMKFGKLKYEKRKVTISEGNALKKQSGDIYDGSSNLSTGKRHSSISDYEGGLVNREERSDKRERVSEDREPVSSGGLKIKD